MRRSLYSVLLGVVLAATAIYLVYGTQTTQEVIVQQVGPDMGIVLVATEDIPFGAQLMEMHVKKMEWPQESIPDDIFQDQADLLESADGRRIAIRAISRGEPFLKSKVSGFGEKPTLSRKVAIDMRAFSIRINDVSGVAGFLLPGDRVDVLLTRTLSSGGKNLITDIILQNVSILGIDQVSNEEGSNPVLARTATIEVSPNDAQKLALAQQIGSLSLTLRNYADLEETNVKRISVSNLSGARPANAPVTDNRAVVRVRKGSTSTSQRVRRD